MSALRAARRFEIIVDALGRAEELGGVALAELATDHGIGVDLLKDVLEPVLYLEFRDSVGTMIDATRSYLVTEDDHLVVTEQHWLGAARSRRPTAEHALRMMIAAMIARSVLPEATDLDRALTKLAEIVDAPIVIEANRPTFTDVCEQALATRRTLSFTYFSELNARRGEWEIEPGFVGSNWGRWYVIGRPVADPGEIRTFRIDRIIDAQVTDRACTPDRAITLPDWWDLDAHRRTVRVRVPRRALDRIPTPAQIDLIDTDPTADSVVADIGVIGDHRLVDLLVMLGTEAEVLDGPPEEPTARGGRVAATDARSLRREQAARILAARPPAH